MLVRALRARRSFRLSVINTGQHLAAVRHTLAGFDVTCDLELPALSPMPNLQHAVRHLRSSIRSALRRIAPDAVVVQGDTSSAYAGARAAVDCGLTVAHVEAGLRTDNIDDPFPEEWFRRCIARHAQWHFAPCASASAHLLDEGVPAERIFRVGNTGIDTLRHVLARGNISVGDHVSSAIVVTLHRRENWDRNAELFCDALLALAARKPEMHIVFPVHPNPRIARRIRRRLGAHLAIHLVEPMEYPDFIRLIASAALAISDSGGIQEEAPHLGMPLLVPRSNTERPECLATGFVELVDVDPRAIVDAAIRVLALPRRNPVPFDDDAPFGAGDASVRISEALEANLLNAGRSHASR
ncbi:MAG: UDP-N-acetylglucosamine 2-epimerase (non-hydrolyzing) [Pseudomonadota bacterium]|nr:UDP-N-acetylglucosamine 2-epimerase (non-hydrolyzing) [Pseudomonadota bacterium]